MNHSKSLSFDQQLIKSQFVVTDQTHDEKGDQTAFDVLLPLIQAALNAANPSEFSHCFRQILSSQRSLSTVLVDILGKQALSLEKKAGNASQAGLLWLKYGFPLVDLTLTGQELLDLLKSIGVENYQLSSIQWVVLKNADNKLKTLVTREKLFQVIWSALEHGTGINKESPIMERFETIGFTEEERIALARKCAGNYSSASLTAPYFKKFGIRSEALRIELAYAYTKDGNYPWAPAEAIEEFEITDLEELEKLALNYAEKAPRNVPEHIGKFCIQTSEMRIRIARLCIKKAAKELARHFARFQISDEKTRFQMAKDCAAFDPAETARFFGHFHLEDPADQLEIAQVCVQKGKAHAAQYLGMFNFLSEEVRVELMRQGMMTNDFPYGFLETSAQCHFKDLHFIKELILTYFKNDGSFNELQHLLLFGITDREFLYELAKDLTAICPWGIVKHIPLFALSPERKVELADMCAKGAGSYFLTHLPNFEINDPQVLDQLLGKISFEKSYYTCTDWDKALENCAIASKEARVQFVLRAICNVESAPNEIPGIVHKLGITDRGQLLQIAQLCSSTLTGAKAVSKHFEHFGAKSEKEILELIRIIYEPLAQFPLLATHRYPDNEQWFSLLEKCVCAYPRELFKFLSLFQSLSIETRFRLAKMSAKADAELTAENYLSFELGENEAMHLEVAMEIVRAKGGSCIAPHVKNFGLKKVENRWTLVRFCLKNPGMGGDDQKTQKHLNAFDLDASPEEMHALALESAHYDPVGTLIHLNQFGISDPKHLFRLIKLCLHLRSAVFMVDHIPPLPQEWAPEMLELYKKCMSEAPRKAFRTLKTISFPIPEKNRYELAISAIQAGYPLTVATNMSFLNISNEEKRALLAKMCFNHDSRSDDLNYCDGESAVLQLPNFKISDPRLLHELFPTALRQNASHALRQLSAFRLGEGKDLLSTLLGLLTRNNVSEIVSNLDAFELDEHAHKTLAINCLRLDASMFAQHIGQFNLDEETRVSIAHELLDRDHAAYLWRNLKAFKISDEKIRLTLARRCAEKATGAFVADLDHFQLNLEGRFEMAMLLAAKGGAIASAVVQCFPHLNIQDEKYKEAIALQAAKSGPTEDYANYFGRLHLQNRKLAEEIFELLLSRFGASMLGGITTFHSQHHLIPRERAATLARMNAQSAICVAKYVQRFDYGLKDRDALFELAALCIEQSRQAAIEVIQQLRCFGFDGSHKWEQLLVKVLSEDPQAVSVFLKVVDKLDLSPETRSALLKSLPQNAPGLDCKDAIDVKYKSDEDLRKLIAIVNQLPREKRLQPVLDILSNNPIGKAMEWINRFELDEQQRCTLALELPKECYEELAEHLPKFNLQHRDTRMQIALKMAESRPKSVAKHFPNFDLSQPELSLLIAEACYTSEPEHIFYRECCEFFDQFHIEEESDRIRLAMAAAKTQPKSLIVHLSLFRISDQQTLLSIASKAIEQDPTCELESLFELFTGNELKLLPLLKSSKRISSVLWRLPLTPAEMHCHLLNCAETEPECLATHIGHYEIENQELLFKLARTLVQNGEAPINLDGITLHNEDKRLLLGQKLIQTGKLCKKLAVQLRITSSSGMSQFAQKWLEVDGVEALNAVKEIFTIEKEEDLYEMLLIAARVSPAGFASQFDSTSISHETNRLHLFLECVRHDEECLRYIDRFALKSSLAGPILIAIDRLNIHQLTAQPAVYAAARDAVHQIFPEEAQGALLQLIGSVEALPLNFQHTSIKWLLHSLLVFGLENNPESAKWIASEQGPWLKLLALRAPPLRAKLTSSLATLSRKGQANSLWQICGPSRLPLLALVLVQLEENGVDSEYLQSIARMLTLRAKDKDSKLRDALAVQRLLMVLDTIAHDRRSSEAKNHLLQRLFKQNNIISLTHKQEEELLERVDAMQGLFGLGSIDDLIENPNIETTHLFECAFQKVVPVDQIPLFSSKYQITFGSCRKPDALRIYASRINSLRNVDAMNALVRYVTGVLNGTFPDDRYALENNPHLSTVFAWRQDLEHLWREPYKRLLSDFSHQTEEKSAFNTTSWLRQKLFNDNHLARPLPYLERYLKEENPSLLEELTQTLQNVPIADRRKDSYKQLKLQQLCILLTKSSQQELAKGALIKQLIGLIEKSPILGQEFLNDLAGLKLTLAGGQKQAGALSVVLSEDYVDLLLCGTEIAGSCQRIDGSVNQNRGLLAYLLDGKNKILVIKDQRGRLHARALLRLLWQVDRPVLFIERLYPSGAPQEHVQALFSAAKEIASKLRLSLYQQEPLFENQPSKLLEAKGGPCPFEYVDAASKMTFWGHFSHLGHLLQEG